MSSSQTVRLYVTAAWFLLLLLCGAAPLHADDYQAQIEPFMQKYCIRCHNSKQAKGELDLTRYAGSGDITANFRRWNHIVEFVVQGEMPPEDATQPTLAERKRVADAVEAILLVEAKKHAGDPGIVLPRRLSRTEYDYSIRDLTGVDIRPTQDFPADPAAGEGFDNTGEALSMSPNLLKKYLAAAQHVSEHLVLKPSGITFAPFSVTSYNERKKLTEQAVIDFYEQHEVRIADYLEACWRYRHRPAAQAGLSIESWAAEHGLSKRYLSLMWQTLHDGAATSGFLRRLDELWHAIPAPDADNRTPAELSALAKFVDFAQRVLCPAEEQLIRSNAGNWPISHLDFRARTAAQRNQFNPDVLQSQRLLVFDRLRAPRDNQKSEEFTLSIRFELATTAGDSNYILLENAQFSKSTRPPKNATEAQRNEVVTLRSVLEQHAPDLAKRLAFGKHPQAEQFGEDSFVVKAPALIEIPLTADLRKLLDGKQLLIECQLDPVHSRKASVYLQHATGNKLPEETLNGTNIQLLMFPDSPAAEELTVSAKRFCQTFPNRFFYVNDRRGLAAGFHLVEGYFRDDQPLMEIVLSDQERRTLNQLWEELHFVTRSRRHAAARLCLVRTGRTACASGRTIRLRAFRRSQTRRT